MENDNYFGRCFIAANITSNVFRLVSLDGYFIIINIIIVECEKRKIESRPLGNLCKWSVAGTDEYGYKIGVLVSLFPFFDDGQYAERCDCALYVWMTLVLEIIDH